MSRTPEGGFTLMEVMIAIVLSAIASIGVMALYRVETRASGFSRHTTEASILATDKMEYLRTQTVPVAGTQANINELGVVGSGIFARSWTVASTLEYIDYTVTVSWTEEGVARTSTLRSRRSL